MTCSLLSPVKREANKIAKLIIIWLNAMPTAQSIETNKMIKNYGQVKLIIIWLNAMPSCLLPSPPKPTKNTKNNGYIKLLFIMNPVKHEAMIVIVNVDVQHSEQLLCVIKTL